MHFTNCGVHYISTVVVLCGSIELLLLRDGGFVLALGVWLFSTSSSHHGLQFIYLSFHLGWEKLLSWDYKQNCLPCQTVYILVSEHSQLFHWTVSHHVSSNGCVSWWPDQLPHEWCCDKLVGENLDLVVTVSISMIFVCKCIQVCVCVLVQGFHVKDRRFCGRVVMVLMLEGPTGTWQ